MHRFQRGKIFESDRCSWDDHFDLEIQETEYPPLLRPDGFLHLEGVTYWCPKLIHPIIDFRTRRFFNLGYTPTWKSPGAFRFTCKSPQKSTQNHNILSWIPNLLLFWGEIPLTPSVFVGAFSLPYCPTSIQRHWRTANLDPTKAALAR